MSRDAQVVPAVATSRLPYLPFIAGFVAVAAAIGVFLPAARYGFVNWDDEYNFTTNAAFRGLKLSNFIWFFTTDHMGHYQPLNWLSFGIDYSISGLSPGRFHLTQIILHGIAAILVFALARRLLQIANPDFGPNVLTFSSLVAALLFAIHPLRVETVVWLSARTHILATIVYLSAILIYLRAYVRSPGHSTSPRTLVTVGLFFLAALLCKEMAVTLPVILLILDIYPLRRLPASPRQWTSPQARRIIAEKIPYFILSLAATVAAFVAAKEGATSLTSHPLSRRFAQLPYAIIFYLEKSLVPVQLSPLYDFPPRFGWSHPRVWGAVGILALLAVIVWRLRRRFPALAAAFAAYVVLVLPISGLTQRGPQLTADRYSYLSCLPWALIGGYLFALGGLRRPALSISTAIATLAALAYRATDQIPLWADSITLWEHAAELDPANSAAFANLGQAYEARGRHDDAINSYNRALALRPHHPNVQRNLGGVYNRLYRNDEAITAYLADLADNPDRLESHYYLAITYERTGDDEKAVKHYRETLRVDARYADAHVALARLFIKHGYLSEAEPRLRRALELNPHHLEALERLARLCGRTHRSDDAERFLRRAVEEAEHRGERELADRLRQAHHEIVGRAASRPATSE